MNMIQADYIDDNFLYVIVHTYKRIDVELHPFLVCIKLNFFLTIFLSLSDLFSW